MVLIQKILFELLLADWIFIQALTTRRRRRYVNSKYPHGYLQLNNTDIILTVGQFYQQPVCFFLDVN